MVTVNKKRRQHRVSFPFLRPAPPHVVLVNVPRVPWGSIFPLPHSLLYPTPKCQSNSPLRPWRLGAYYQTQCVRELLTRARRLCCFGLAQPGVTCAFVGFGWGASFSPSSTLPTAMGGALSYACLSILDADSLGFGDGGAHRASPPNSLDS